MKLYLLIVIILLLGAFFIVSENRLALKDKKDRIKFGDLYLSWIGQIFENSGRLAGYVVKLDWLPGNRTG